MILRAGNFRDQRAGIAGSEECSAARGIGGDFFRRMYSRSRPGNFHGDAGEQTSGAIDHGKRGLRAGNDRLRQNDRARNGARCVGVSWRGDRRRARNYPHASHKQESQARARTMDDVPREKHGRDSTAAGRRMRNGNVSGGAGVSPAVLPFADGRKPPAGRRRHMARDSAANRSCGQS